MRLYKVKYTTDEEGKKIAEREEIPSKYHCDENGNYWEYRGTFSGQNLFVPAPVWAGHINFYLFEGPEIFIEPHSKPLCNVPIVKRGADPVDGGNLIMTTEEKDTLLRTDPNAEAFIRPFMMGKDFIYRVYRWCLWLKGIEPADIRKCPRVLERLEKCRDFRLKSKSKTTQRAADTPMLFLAPRECTTNYLAIPKVSSEKRKYIPIAWLPPDVIAGDKLFVCENAELYHFGVLMSSVHMSWVRHFSGRLTSRFSYSNTIDYNAFPWPDVPRTLLRIGDPPEKRFENPKYTAIEKTAQAILDARSKYPRSTLADLYDERTMPPELRKAHNDNDEAVMNAYGFKRHFEDDRQHDEDIAINLMYMYKELTGCREFYEDYTNLKHWESYYGKYSDDEEDEEE